MMRFSIVTPSYNQGQYLEETLVSVLGQEGDFHIDYLVMDGGSSDDSVAIIQRYDERLKKGDWPLGCRGINFRWQSGRDGGQTDALQKGFAMASGEVFTWLNSDDTYLPGTLQAAAACLRDQPRVALLYGDAHYSDSNGKIIGRYPTAEFDLTRLAYSNFFCQPATFFRREAFAAVGGLNAQLNFSMDYELFIRLAKQFECHYLPQYLATYRLHEASKTMGPEDLYRFHREIEQVTRKYFGWAPLNRVYGVCHYYWLSRLPARLQTSRLAVTVPALGCTLLRSLRLNRGVRREDLKLLNRSNWKKLFQERIDILTG